MLFKRGNKLVVGDDFKAKCKRFSPVALVTSAAVFAQSSAFAVDPTIDVASTGAIATALTAAKSDAYGVGALIIGFVAGIIIFGIIISMMKKA